MCIVYYIIVFLLERFIVTNIKIKNSTVANIAQFEEQQTTRIEFTLVLKIENQRYKTQI